MIQKQTYEELEQRIQDLKKEAFEHKQVSKDAFSRFDRA